MYKFWRLVFKPKHYSFLCETMLFHFVLFKHPSDRLFNRLVVGKHEQHRTGGVLIYSTLLSSSHGDKGPCQYTNQCTLKLLRHHPIWRPLRNSVTLP